MLIQIESDRGQPPSWAMIELQGEVERKLENTDRAFDVGRLESNSDGSINLTIGYHQLEGAKVRLKKPLAVMQKSEGTDGGMKYAVIGVVKEKYLFKSRPRPLITKPDSSKK